MNVLTGAVVVYQSCKRYKFTLDGCPAGTVINIQSAGAEFRETCQNETRASCTRSIISHPAIVSCNGQRSCSFGRYVLEYPQHNVTRLCDEHEDGNFLWIKYDCDISKKHVTLSLCLSVCDTITCEPHNTDFYTRILNLLIHKHYLMFKYI